MQRLFELFKRGRATFDLLRKKDQELGSCHRSFRSIHVAGTNGKGSVSFKIAKVLENLGYKVGLFSSPHIFDVRERIQINGCKIPEEIAKSLTDRVMDPDLSFFDCLTLMSFLYFAQEKVDFAVMEAGIGGRLDATNVITPILSIITSIGLDHAEILGSSLEEIAREKGGIIKPNVPLVVGPSAAPFFKEGIFSPSAPFFEDENRLIAKTALLTLGIEEEKGLEKRPPCRFEKRGKLLLDVAHNPQGFHRLIQALEIHYPNRKFPFFLAFSKDKKWQECVDIVREKAISIQMIQSSHPLLRQHYPGYEVVPSASIQEGVVAGSFYVMQEIQSSVGDFDRLGQQV